MSARAIIYALKGRWHGKYGAACCPAHGDRNPSLSLWDCPDGSLGAKCHAGCDYGSVMAALRDRGLIEPGTYGRRLDPQVEAQRRAEEQADRERSSQYAKRIWEQTLPIAGTPAERYLRRRGITCSLPSCLRFAPDLRHPERQTFPAMVALIEGSNGFAVHRTWLRSDGTGKADITPQKAMLGSVNGGAVRLLADGAPLVVAEGIETALSLACGILTKPATIWAALSATHMQGLRLPSRPGRLTIAADGDAKGLEAATTLAKRAYGLGWKVYMLRAPDDQDWNDVLRSQEALAS